MKTFKKQMEQAPNEVLEFEGAHFSYNLNNGDTALCYADENALMGMMFSVKVGDLRKDLEKAKDLKDAVNIFLESSNKYSGFSEIGGEQVWKVFN